MRLAAEAKTNKEAEEARLAKEARKAQEKERARNQTKIDRIVTKNESKT